MVCSEHQRIATAPHGDGHDCNHGPKLNLGYRLLSPTPSLPVLCHANSTLQHNRGVPVGRYRLNMSPSRNRYENLIESRRTTPFVPWLSSTGTQTPPHQSTVSTAGASQPPTPTH